MNTSHEINDGTSSAEAPWSRSGRSGSPHSIHSHSGDISIHFFSVRSVRRSHALSILLIFILLFYHLVSPLNLGQFGSVTLTDVCSVSPGGIPSEVRTGGDYWCRDRRVTYNLSSSRNPDMAIDDDNSIHIVWQDLRMGNREIYYVKLSERGAKLINDMRLTNDSSSSIEPKILLGTGGNLIHIIWSDNGTGSWEIYHMSFSYGNKTIEIVTGKKQISDPDAFDSRCPDAVLNGNGKIRIAWQDRRDGNWEIYYCVIDGKGSVVVSDMRITADLYDSTRCSLDVDSEANTHIAYHEFRNATGNLDTNYGVHYIKLNETGVVVMDSRRLSIASAMTVPELCIDSEDFVHVVFDDTRYNVGNASDVIYTMLDSNGTTLIDDVTITPVSEASEVDSREPVIAIDSHNNLHIIWMDDRDGFYGIYYTMLDPDNYSAVNPYTLEQQITLVGDMRLTGSVSGSQSPVIGIDAKSNLHLVWQDERSGSWELFYTRTEKPDLVIKGDSLDITPPDPVGGDHVQCSATVRDTQGAGAITTAVHFYYLEKERLSGGEIANLTHLPLVDYLALLDDRGTRFHSEDITLRVGVMVDVEAVLNTSELKGVLYVSVIVDPYRSVDEINDGNNHVIEELFVSNYSVAIAWRSDPMIETEVNSTLVLEAEIENRGNDVNDVLFSCTGDDGRWFCLSPGNATLPVGGASTVRIEGFVPPDTTAGTYNITIHAGPVRQASVAESLTFSVKVLQFAQISLTPSKSHYGVLPGYKNIRFTVVNRGNREDTISITSSSNSGWNCVFEDHGNEADLMLDQGESRDIWLNVSVPNSSPNVEDCIAVTARSKSDDAVEVSIPVTLEVLAVRKVKVIKHDPFAFVAAGGSVNFTIGIRNLGNVVDWYAAYIDYPNDLIRNYSMSVANRTNISVNAGEMYNLTLNVVTEPFAFGKEYKVAFRVESIIKAGVEAETTLRIDVKEDHSFSVNPTAPQTVTTVPGRPAQFRFDVRNTGNVNNTLYLKVEGDKRKWWSLEYVSTSMDKVPDELGGPFNYTTQSIKMNIIPDETKAVFIEVVPDIGTPPGSHNYTIEIYSTLDHSGEKHSPVMTMTAVIENETASEPLNLFVIIIISATALAAVVVGLVIVLRYFRSKRSG